MGEYPDGYQELKGSWASGSGSFLSLNGFESEVRNPLSFLLWSSLHFLACNFTCLF